VSLIFDDRYKGKNLVVRRSEHAHGRRLYLGFKDAWNQSDDELKRSQQLLIEKKKNVRLICRRRRPLGGFGRATSGCVRMANDWCR